MILSITQDKDLFVLGKLQKGQITTQIHSQSTLWNEINKIGRKENKQGRSIYVYAVRHKDLWYKYANLEDKRIRTVSTKTFLKLREETEKEKTNRIEHLQNRKTKPTTQNRAYITFTDLLNIYTRSIGKKRDPLETIAELIEEEYKDNAFTKAILIIKAIQKIKEKTKAIGVQTKTLYSINQIAISNCMQNLRQTKIGKELFKDETLTKLAEHKNTRLININRQYKNPWSRGGYSKAFKKGTYKNCHYIDSNGNWQWALKTMRCPDLKTETLIKEAHKYYTAKELYKQLGVSKALLQVPKIEVGILGIRKENTTIYPNNKEYIIGWWTHEELQYATSIGYKTISIEETILWKALKENPFKEIIEKLYTLRKESKDYFDNWFYKQMGNSFVGKMNMAFPEYDYKHIKIKEREEYEEKGYEVVDSYEYQEEQYYIIEKEQGLRKRSYYAPIIYAQTTAKSRVYMHKAYMNILQAKGQLLYTDTDSIICNNINIEKIKEILPIGQKQGEWKIEGENKECQIWETKFYRYDKEVHTAGIKEGLNSIHDFNTGTLIRERNHEGNIERQIIDFTKEKEERQTEQNIYIDEYLENISYFNKWLIKLS